jgi:N-formylglutamate amidohydrolase
VVLDPRSAAPQSNIMIGISQTLTPNESELATSLQGDVVEIVRASGAGTKPIIFASPHSGRNYAEDLLSKTILPLNYLRRSEDAYVDQFIESATEEGAEIIQALFPRVFVDPNRGPWELDPGMFSDTLPAFVDTKSKQAAHGLGVVPRIAADGRRLYRHRFTFDEARSRIGRYYFPYHNALSQLIEEIRNSHGVTVLLDMHSMPESSSKGADFVLGDRFGMSCDDRVTQSVEAILNQMGYVTVRNTPYAGGYTTKHYGRPKKGVHVLQIEINRGLYLDEKRVILKRDHAKFTATLRKFINKFCQNDWVSLLSS